MNLKNSQIILYGFLIRFANAFYGSFVGQSLGSNSDASSFHFRATAPWYDSSMGRYESIFRQNSFILDGSQFYIKILELVYNIFWSLHLYWKFIIMCSLVSFCKSIDRTILYVKIK